MYEEHKAFYAAEIRLFPFRRPALLLRNSQITERLFFRKQGCDIADRTTMVVIAHFC